MDVFSNVLPLYPPRHQQDLLTRELKASKSNKTSIRNQPGHQIPTDKTIVTLNVKVQKVDVYRITLDKAKWSVSRLILVGGSDPVEFGGHGYAMAVGEGGRNCAKQGLALMTSVKRILWRNKTTPTFLSKGCCIVIMLCE